MGQVHGYCIWVWIFLTVLSSIAKYELLQPNPSITPSRSTTSAFPAIKYPRNIQALESIPLYIYSNDDKIDMIDEMMDEMAG